MKLSPHDRMEMLLQVGYSQHDIRRASIQTKTTIEQRQWTKDTPDMQLVEEVVERSIRIVTKPFRRYRDNHCRRRRSSQS